MAKLTAQNSLRLQLQCTGWAMSTPYKRASKQSWASKPKHAKPGICRHFVHDGQGNYVLTTK